MKRIIMSLAMIVMVGASTIAATRAWFTDQEVLGTNTLSSGKLNVDLRGANAAGINIPVDTTQTFEGGLLPGKEFGPYEVQVYNLGWGESTTPVKFSWTQTWTGGNTTLFDNLYVKVREGNCDWLGAGWFEPNSGWLYGDATTWLLLKNMGRVISASNLGVNITRCTWFYFRLDPLADNTLQGLTTKFNLVLDATQPENPGWNEAGT